MAIAITMSLLISECWRRAGIVAITLRRSRLWSQFKEFYLTVNERVERAPGPDRAAMEHWAAFLLQVGQGELPKIQNTQCICMPEELLLPTQEALVDYVYGDLYPLQLRTITEQVPY